MALFCFQLSRVYFVDRVDAFYTCPYTQLWTSTASDDSAESANISTEGFDEVFASDSDSRSTVRACKNSADGLALSPVQPLGETVAILPLRPETNWIRLAEIVNSPPDTDSPRLFQPPRTLSRSS